MRAAGYVLAVGLLGGCGTAPPPRHVALDDAQCATSILALRPHALRPAALDRRKPAPLMDFADVGQCLATATGRVATALFDVRMVAPPAQASITIVANSAATLATAVTLLDSQRQPIRRIGFSQFVRRGDTFTLDVFVNRSDRDAAYLLLTPDSAWVGKSDLSRAGGVSTVMIPVGLGFAAFNNGFEAQRSRALTDAGKLRIELTPVMN